MLGAVVKKDTTAASCDIAHCSNIARINPETNMRRSIFVNKDNAAISSDLAAPKDELPTIIQSRNKKTNWSLRVQAAYNLSELNGNQ